MTAAALEQPPAAWQFTLTCHYCGALCQPRNATTPNGREQRLVADCTECAGEMLVVVVLRPALRSTRTSIDDRRARNAEATRQWRARQKEAPR